MYLIYDVDNDRLIGTTEKDTNIKLMILDYLDARYRAYIDKYGEPSIPFKTADELLDDNAIIVEEI